MFWPILIMLATFLVAYANGANDNFKGVATLFGSGTTDYKKALLWATLTTGAGSLAAFFFAGKLIAAFSGKGLVPDALLADPSFLVAVILGAGLTVLIAARFGIPVSTTHGLTGALVGAGLVAAGTRLGWLVLTLNFLIPLLVSPVMAMGVTLFVYPAARSVSKLLGICKNTCLCVGERRIPLGAASLDFSGVLSVAQLSSLDIILDETEICAVKAVQVYEGRMFGIEAQKILDFLHFLSAGAVSFARGLNDTPKIVAISVAAGMLGLRWNILGVVLMMALGGFLSARRVAETMSHKITAMSHGQGFSANLITSLLVIFASQAGLPVSTTHVSCGALFGIGLANGKARWKVISGIVGAWVLTLPVAAGTAAMVFLLLSRIFQK